MKNNSQSIVLKTEYVEAFALYYYCVLNSLDFKREIEKRRKIDLNVFPDFVTNNRLLEVARAINEVEGKQMKDDLDVFGSSNRIAAAIKKNEELKKYSGKDSHFIEYQIINGKVSSIREMVNTDIYAHIIENIIMKKYKTYRSRLFDVKPLDLFLIENKYVPEDSFEKVFSWYKKNNDVSSFFESVYILSSSETLNCYDIRIMNKNDIVKRTVASTISMDELIDTIVKLGWIKQCDESNDVE